MAKPQLKAISGLQSPYCEQALLIGIDRLPDAKVVCVATLKSNGGYHLDWGGGTAADQALLSHAVLRSTLMAHQDEDA